MRVTLVRHGEVDKAYINKYNGHLDIELSKSGYAQAQMLAEHFASSKFDKVFCSDLMRAKETLKAFSQSQDAIYTDKLREKSWGRDEGLSFNEICEQEGIEYINFMQWIDALDGEEYNSYVNRVREFFLEYLPSLKCENVLVVTHAGVIKTLLSIVKKTTLEDAFSLSLPYGSYTVYDSKEKSFSEVKCF